MSQLISDFLRVAAKRGIHRDYQFRIVQIGDTRFDEEDLVYIRSATIPDRQIASHQAKFMGLDFQIPGTASYPGSDGWDVRFYCDKRYEIRDKMELWSRETFDDATSIGDLSIPGVEKVIEMQLLNDNLEVLKTYMLVGVGVRKLGTIEYIREGDGNLLEFTSSLAYHYYTTK